MDCLTILRLVHRGIRPARGGLDWLVGHRPFGLRRSRICSCLPIGSPRFGCLVGVWRRYETSCPYQIGITLLSDVPQEAAVAVERSEEHTSALQSLMRISYAVFCLKKKTNRI